MHIFKVPSNRTGNEHSIFKSDNSKLNLKVLLYSASRGPECQRFGLRSIPLIENISTRFLK